MNLCFVAHPQMDLVCLSEEPAPKAGVSLNYYPLGLDKTVQSIIPAQVTSLRLDVFSCGQVSAANTEGKVLKATQSIGK